MFFEIEVSILKYVLYHSESIPIKKIFNQKFLTLPFFQLMTPFLKKMAMSPEKNQYGIFFEIEIFILKYILEHFESIPIKKSSTKIFYLQFFQTRPHFSIFRK